MLKIVVPSSDEKGFGVAVAAALDVPECQAVVLLPREDEHLPAHRLERLLTGQLDIAAVVPRIVRPDGDLVETGAMLCDGRTQSRHLRPGAGGDSVERADDVDGSEYPWIAFRSGLVPPGAIDSKWGPAEVATFVINKAHQIGSRVVYEPGWTVQATDAKSVAVTASRSYQESAQEILVVTASLDSTSIRGRDRFAQTLIDDLVGLLGEDAVTVAVLDGFRCHPEGLRRRGVAIHCGPMSWLDWLRTQWGRFSHVVITRTALATPIGAWLDATQPQAYRVLALDELPSRGIEASRPVTQPDEIDGIDYVVELVDARLRKLITASHGVICGAAADASRLRATEPGLPVVHLASRSASRNGAIEVPFAERQGIVLLAVDGADVLAANEEAALAAIHAVVDQLRNRWPDLPVTVVADEPSPQLFKSIEDRGLRLVPTRECQDALARARVALALHPAGSGGADTIWGSLQARTPFVATSMAAKGVDIDEMRAWSVYDSDDDIRIRTAELLSDEAAWSHARRALDAVAFRHCRTDRTESLRGLLIGLGLDARPRSARWPEEEAVEPHAAREYSQPPRLRPTAGVGSMADPFTGDSGPRDEVKRYRRWQERYGPNTEALHDFRREVSRLKYRPLISVIVPVYNPDPEVLRAAIESVRDQVYDHWQLCIADDGSTRSETLEVLGQLVNDPSIRLAQLPGNSGIAAASNAALDLADGEFVAFMDHDDLLKPHALAQIARWLDSDPEIDLLYTDEDKIDSEGNLRDPHLKPDWSPDLLMSVNYISHLTVIRRSIVKMVGGLRPGYEGGLDYDLLLRVTEKTDRIAHIPEPLYTCRMVAGSTSQSPDSKPYAANAAKRALADALDRRGLTGWIRDTQFPTFYRTSYAIPGKPQVSIIIPTKDGIELLRPCIESIIEKTTYSNYEIVVVDNQSTDGETLEYLAKAPINVVRYPHHFNYSRQMNLAAASVAADVLVFLNNDTTVITPEWLEALLEHAMRPNVGAVGCRLYYPSGQVQHEGILVGVAGGWAWNTDHKGYFSRGDLIRNASAVTGACTAMRSTTYARIGGNDERLRIAYNDVDICLRVRQAGMEVVYTPYAELFHYEGATRGRREHDGDGPIFGRKWQVLERVDPYHSPLFGRDCVDNAFVLAL